MFDVETDCSEAIALINDKGPNISAYAFQLNVIRDVRVLKISRVLNQASHELAKLGRIQGRTELWMSTAAPPEITTVLQNNCNPMSN
jgi:hypothetical protein